MVVPQELDQDRRVIFVVEIVPLCSRKFPFDTQVSAHQIRSKLPRTVLSVRLTEEELELSHRWIRQ